MLLAVLHIGGLVLLVASAAAVWFNGRVIVVEQPALWRRLWPHRWQVGILLGLVSFFSGYPTYGETSYGVTERTWVIGIPFIFGASDAQGLYPGFGMPALVANFVFWLLLPQFVLWVTSRRKRRPTPGESAPVSSHTPGPAPSRADPPIP